MRWWMVACALVAGCSQRYGAYLTITSQHDATAFDELELFFTTPDGADTTGRLAPRNTSGDGTIVPPVQTTLFIRSPGANDDWQSTAGTVTSASFEIPAAEAALLGPTVIIVARRAGTIVGYARIDDLQVPAGQYYKYPAITITPQPAGTKPAGAWPPGADVWQPAAAVVGNGANGQHCARVTENGATTFVVTDGDLDCDGFDDDREDCLLNMYCDPANAAGAAGSCTGACLAPVGVANCGVGACTNSATPMDRTCVVPAVNPNNATPWCVACTSACDYRQPPDFESCIVAKEPPTARCTFDIETTTQTLCTPLAPAEIDLSAWSTNLQDCANAIVLFPPGGDDGAFKYKLHLGSSSVCSVQLQMVPDSVTQTFTTPRRILIGLPAAQTATLPTVEVLITPTTTATECIESCTPATVPVVTCTP